MAVQYIQLVHKQKEYSYLNDSYLAKRNSILGFTYSGSTKALSKVLECRRPDEVVVPPPPEEFRFTWEECPRPPKRTASTSLRFHFAPSISSPILRLTILMGSLNGYPACFPE